jgi:hypothetical protein
MAAWFANEVEHIGLVRAVEPDNQEPMPAG